MKKIALIIVVAFMLVGCSKSTSEKLLGKWIEKDVKETMEFFEDGTLTMATPRGEDVPGKWLISEDGRLKIQINAFGQELVILAKVEFKDDNNVTLDSKEEGPMTLKRVISTK